MFQFASLKIIFTDSTEILFSKLRSAVLNYHLPKLSVFFTQTLTVRRVSNKHCFHWICFSISDKGVQVSFSPTDWFDVRWSTITIVTV